MDYAAALRRMAQVEPEPEEDDAPLAPGAPWAEPMFNPVVGSPPRVAPSPTIPSPEPTPETPAPAPETPAPAPVPTDDVAAAWATTAGPAPVETMVAGPCAAAAAPMWANHTVFVPAGGAPFVFQVPAGWPTLPPLPMHPTMPPSSVGPMMPGMPVMPPALAAPAMPPQVPMSREPCKYHFHSNEPCKYGETCWFSHSQADYMAYNQLKFCPNEHCDKMCLHTSKQCKACHDAMRANKPKEKASSAKKGKRQQRQSRKK